MAVSDCTKSIWTNGRLTPFYCLMLSGIFLDAYFNWYSFHFAAECAESGNGVPPSFFMFTAISAIPAGASIIFGRSLLYKVPCLALWIFYCGCVVFVNGEQFSIERQFGINCYRDVGGAGVVSFVFTAVFAAAIIALTTVVGVIALGRLLFSGGSNRSAAPVK